MKSYYSDYVRHCMKYYIAHPDGDFQNGIDKANWHACDEALKKFSDIDKNMLLYIYRQNGCTMREAIDRGLYGSDMRPNYVWRIIGQLEKEIASKRGL